MALNKDYIALSNEAQKQQKYRHYQILGTDVDCVICHKNKCTEVFFPCQHLCACSGCIKEHNIGVRDRPEKAAWRQCPLCNADIRKVSRVTGKEDVQYWDWVHEISPPLPSGFKKRWVPPKHLMKVVDERASSIQKQKQGQDSKTGNSSVAQAKEQQQPAPGALLRGWGDQNNPTPGAETTTAEDDAEGGAVVVKTKKQMGGCCVIC